MPIEYNRELVIAKTKQTFPREDLAGILAILDLYGTESYEREAHRVHIAIIMLSDGSVDKLLELVSAAKSDYRDVLAWAEYPEELRAPTWRMPEDENKSIRQRDRQRYLDWLKS